MAEFDRMDICGAHQALENDWNVGGWLKERKSNDRRRESTGVQLKRIGFRSGTDTWFSFESLENDNQREIYLLAAERCGLQLRQSDPSHRPILSFAREAGIGVGSALA